MWLEKKKDWSWTRQRWIGTIEEIVAYEAARPGIPFDVNEDFKQTRDYIGEYVTPDALILAICEGLK